MPAFPLRHDARRSASQGGGANQQGRPGYQGQKLIGYTQDGVHMTPVGVLVKCPDTVPILREDSRAVCLFWFYPTGELHWTPPAARFILAQAIEGTVGDNCRRLPGNCPELGAAKANQKSMEGLAGVLMEEAAKSFLAEASPQEQVTTCFVTQRDSLPVYAAEESPR